MRRNTLTIFLCLAAVLISAAVIGCSTQEGRLAAKVGDRKIMVEEVEGILSRAGARFATADDELSIKRELLDTLVNQNLLIIGAYEHNLEKHDEVIKAVQGEEIKFLLDVLFEKEILEKAIPSEAEIKDWYNRMDVEIKASHIVVDSESTALEVLQKLKEGVVFEELAIQFSRDPYVSRDQGDLGWFTWGKMMDNFQNVAFKMKPGEISAPVKTPMGYHIIKLVDRRKVEHRPGYSEMKDYVRQMIIERRKGELMQAYAKKLKEKYPITVEKPTCEFVLNKLEFLYPETIGGRPRWRNNIDPNQLDLDEKALVLGRYTGGQLTIGTYLDNLRRVAPDKRPDFDHYDSLQEIVFEMAFMDILAVEARELGYDESKQYKDKVRRFKELAMADVMRNDTIPAGVEVNEGEVQEYYDTHPEEFTTPLRFSLLEIQVADENQANTYAKTIRTEDEFKRAASAETQRPGKKQVGGDLGIITKEQFPELYDLAGTVLTGRIAGPVKIGGKYSVIWVKQRIEPVRQDFTTVKRSVIDKLTKQKGDALYGQWIADMKKRIPIEIYENVVSESVDKSKYTQPDSTKQTG